MATPTMALHTRMQHRERTDNESQIEMRYIPNVRCIASCTLSETEFVIDNLLVRIHYHRDDKVHRPRAMGVSQTLALLDLISAHQFGEPRAQRFLKS